MAETWDLFDWIGQTARAVPDLKEIGEAVRVKRK